MAAGLDKSLRVWELRQPSEACRVTVSAAENEKVRDFAFSADGRTTMTLAGSALTLRDTATMMPLAEVALPQYEMQSSVRISASRFANWGSLDATCILELPSGRELFRLPRVHHSFHCLPAFVPDGALMAVLDYPQPFKNAANPAIRLWNMRTGSLVQTFRGHESFVSAIELTHDGALLASASTDNTVRLWNAATGEQLRRANFTNGVGSMALAPDEGSLLVGDQVGGVHLLELKTLREIRRFSGHSYAVNAVGFSSDGRLAASTDGTLRIWDVASGRSLHAFAGRCHPVFAPDGRSIFVSSVGPAEWGTVEARVFGSTRQPPSELEILDFDRPGRYREFQRDLRAVRAALQANPNDAAALRKLGEYFAFRHVNDWAVDLLERARTSGADVSPLLLARCYWQLNQREDAGREFQGAMKRNEAPNEYLTLCLKAVTAPPATAPASVVRSAAKSAAKSAATQPR
jgi:WD40 repeat protein